MTESPQRGDGPPEPSQWGTPPPPLHPSWQQPYASQPLPPAYAAAPPAPVRSKLPWLLGALVLVLALVGGGVALLLLRGGGPAAGQPESAVKSFLTAAKAGNCGDYTATTTQHFRDTYGSCSGNVDTSSILGAGVLTIGSDVTIRDQTANAATGEVQVSAAGFTLPMQLQLVRQGDAWLVDDVTIAGFGLNQLQNLNPGAPPS